MKKLFITIAVALAGFTGVVVAQQDPQFTQFMHNKLIYNPGYAGTSSAICGVAQYRQQWASLEGAPQSIAVAADMPLKAIPLGVGINIMSDKIGPMNTVFARLAGAYNLKIGKGKLGVGVDFGMMQKKINNDWVTPEPLKPDPRIPTNTADLNKVTFDLGLGAFYQIPGQFYIGISSTHLPAQTINGDAMQFDLTRHYYAMVGYTFKVTPWVKFTPNLMYKSDLASTALDANGTIMLFDKFWAGASYRLNDATAVLLGVQLPFGTGNSTMLKIGYSYDITLSSKLKGFNSHEVILGVCYTPRVIKPTTHGTDRFLD